MTTTTWRNAGVAARAAAVEHQARATQAHHAPARRRDPITASSSPWSVRSNTRAGAVVARRGSPVLFGRLCRPLSSPSATAESGSASRCRRGRRPRLRAHARAPRRSAKIPGFRKGKVPPRGGRCSAWAARRSSRRRCASSCRLGGRGDRRGAPAARRPAERRLRAVPPARASRSRSRRSSRCGRPARCPRSSSSRACRRTSTVAGRGGRRRARAPARGVLAARRRSSAPAADGRLRRGRHARQRRRQAGARGLHRRLPRPARHRAHVRGDRARAARHERRARRATPSCRCPADYPDGKLRGPQRRRRAARRTEGASSGACCRRSTTSSRATPPSSTRSPSCAPRSRAPTASGSSARALALPRRVLGSLGEAVEVELPP